MATKIIAAFAVLGLAGCVSAPAVTCGPWKPLRFSEPAIEAMDGQDLSALNVHNLTGSKLCRWKR